MSPPIRALGHDKALQAALSTGNLQVFSLVMGKMAVRLFTHKR